MGRKLESQGNMAEPSHTWIHFLNVDRSYAVHPFRKKGEHKIDLWILMP